MQGILFTLLLVTSFPSEGVEASQQNVCDAEAQVKLSMIAGLRRTHTMKLKDSRELKTVVEDLERTLNIMLNETAKLETLMQNITTPELDELEASHTCEGGIARDCCQIKQMLPSVKSGLYAIRDPCSGKKHFSYAKLIVNCDMETDGGGWTIIQQRNADSRRVNFTRGWEDYENGFGELDGEFWIGLKNIYEMTNQQDVTLRISVWNDTITWNYRSFVISGPNEKYALLDTVVHRGRGDPGTYGAFGVGGLKENFSTFDRDYERSNFNCGYVPLL